MCFRVLLYHCQLPLPSLRPSNSPVGAAGRAVHDHLTLCYSAFHAHSGARDTDTRSTSLSSGTQRGSDGHVITSLPWSCHHLLELSTCQPNRGRVVIGGRWIMVGDSPRLVLTQGAVWPGWLAGLRIAAIAAFQGRLGRPNMRRWRGQTIPLYNSAVTPFHPGMFGSSKAGGGGEFRTRGGERSL